MLRDLEPPQERSLRSFYALELPVRYETVTPGRRRAGSMCSISSASSAEPLSGPAWSSEVAPGRPALLQAPAA